MSGVFFCIISTYFGKESKMKQTIMLFAVAMFAFILAVLTSIIVANLIVRYPIE